MLNLLPLHPVHELIPAAAYLPAVHTALVLLPLHEWPAGHALHEARVVQLPPAVKEPAPHVLQLVDPVPLYLLSLPHGGILVQIRSQTSVKCQAQIHFVNGQIRLCAAVGHDNFKLATRVNAAQRLHGNAASEVGAVQH